MITNFTTYLLLLGLSQGPLHGYGLSQYAHKITDGAVRLSPATLYGQLGKLEAEHLIEQIPLENDPRRISYRLTKRGWDQFHECAKVYATIGKHSQNAADR